MKVSINHEIHTKNLKILTFFLRVYHNRTGSYRICSYFLHFWKDFLIKIISIPMLPLKIFLKVLITYLISFLIFSILREILLDSIVGKMNRSKSMLSCILERSRTNISKLVPITLYYSIY